MDWKKEGNFVTVEEAVKAIKDNDNIVFGHAAGVPGDQPGVQRRAQIAHMHIAGGRGCEAGAHSSFGNAALHIFKKCHIKCHFETSVCIEK